MSEPLAETDDTRRREVQCFQILPFGRWCRLPWGHNGDHEPNRQAG